MPVFQSVRGRKKSRERKRRGSKSREDTREDPALHSLAFASRYDVKPIPKHRMPEQSIEPRMAYQLVHDELTMEFAPLRNMATFLSTWGEPEAEELMKECFGKNLADRDQYTALRKIESRCIDMLNDMFHANPADSPTGASTVGSSEALMLGALVMKRRWRNSRRQRGLSTDRPNLIMGAHVHVSWFKFANYFEVEPRIVPLKSDHMWLDGQMVKNECDENTIGVICILGNTYTGHYDNVADINNMLTKLHKDRGWDIPIHVDAASGGFVAPFLYPDVNWDFRLPRVMSINVSSHKYGLVFPGAGFVLFRDKDTVPEELVYHVSYLGGDEPTFSFNFSRSSSQIVMQYYNFIRLGREGYTRILKNCNKNAQHLAERLMELEFEGTTPIFEIASNTFEHPGIPLVAVKLVDEISDKFTVFDLMNSLKAHSWAVPAYNLCKGAEDVSVLKFVVKESQPMDVIDTLVDDLEACLHDFKDIGLKKDSDRKAGNMVV